MKKRGRQRREGEGRRNSSKLANRLRREERDGERREKRKALVFAVKSAYSNSFVLRRW